VGKHVALLETFIWVKKDLGRGLQGERGGGEADKLAGRFLLSTVQWKGEGGGGIAITTICSLHKRTASKKRSV